MVWVWIYTNIGRGWHDTCCSNKKYLLLTIVTFSDIFLPDLWKIKYSMCVYFILCSFHACCITNVRESQQFLYQQSAHSFNQKSKCGLESEVEQKCFRVRLKSRHEWRHFMKHRMAEPGQLVYWISTLFVMI